MLFAPVIEMEVREGNLRYGAGGQKIHKGAEWNRNNTNKNCNQMLSC